jgi:hypothetical protein
MGTEKSKTLSGGQGKGFNAKNAKAQSSAPTVPQTEDAQLPATRIENLRNIPSHILRNAWFTMAHLLLPNGAKVVDIGCEDGAITHAMAALHPQLHFTGVSPNSQAIAKAKKTYRLPNLEFRTADITGDCNFQPESLDAVVNSFILHEIYSGRRFNDRQVSETLECQFELLKQDGLMFIRDFALLYPGEYVLMEMPDVPSRGKDIQTMTETDLLLWYSDHARPKDDSGCNGFFLEELPARFPQTRLFRLPYKWAYEFIMRKDSRAVLQDELHKEYTFFTQREFRKTLRSLGARTLYSAPLWDEKTIDKRFKGRFRLYDDNGNPLGMPPTSFLAVAQKVGSRKSLGLEERRPSQKAPTGHLRVTAMRNERTGRIVDIVSRDVDITEVIPYRITDQGRLNVFVHEGLPRGIINAVPRNGRDLDGKQWSGHMVEAMSVPTDTIASVEQGEVKEVVRFARDYLGLKPAIDSRLEPGHSYYPAPDYIDDVIKTRYLRVTEREGSIEPRIVMDDIRGFTTTGRIRELDAQEILDSVTVGFTPNARLELQILLLFDRLGMKAETWSESPLTLDESEPDAMFDGQDFARLKSMDDSRFKSIKGTAGQLRTVQSIFVDEGWVDGGISGLASRDMEFVISDEHSLNRAVILPLTKKDNDVLLGMEIEYLPVPQRQSGNGLVMKAPSVTLPRTVTDIHQAKKFIADLFKVSPDDVWRLGESYFCHTGITPQRIFPFAVSSTGSGENPIGGPIQFAPMKYIWNVIDKMLDWNHDLDFISAVRKGYQRLGYCSDLNLKWAAGRDAFYQQRGHDILNVSNVAAPSSPAAGGEKSSPISEALQMFESNKSMRDEPFIRLPVHDRSSGRHSDSPAPSENSALSDNKKLHIK